MGSLGTHDGWNDFDRGETSFSPRHSILVPRGPLLA
jgi:hypothetical protein